MSPPTPTFLRLIGLPCGKPLSPGRIRSQARSGDLLWFLLGFPPQHCCRAGPQRDSAEALLPQQGLFRGSFARKLRSAGRSGKWVRHWLSPLPRASSSLALPPLVSPPSFRISGLPRWQLPGAFFRFRSAAPGHTEKLTLFSESHKRNRLWIKCIAGISSAAGLAPEKNLFLVDQKRLKSSCPPCIKLDVRPISPGSIRPPSGPSSAVREHGPDHALNVAETQFELGRRLAPQIVVQWIIFWHRHRMTADYPSATQFSSKVGLVGSCPS